MDAADEQQSTNDSVVLEQIREIEKLIRLARAPEGWALRRVLLMHRTELQELLGLMRELIAAGGRDAIEQ